MSDYYSLNKIVYYIHAIEDKDDVNILMIERVLQVTGEMLNSSGKSNHLWESTSTKSLLPIAVSVETVKYPCNFLSHADEGQLSTRIIIAKKLFKIIKQIIITVLDFYKTFFDKSLLDEGLHL